jgi:Na+/proline symporter
MESVDWAIVFGFLFLSLVIGILFTKRAGSGLEEFFLSGRSLPWWLTGTSMVATSFSADTPLAVTELVRTYGVAGNWLWWCYGFGGMLSVFVFARFWRRAEVLTDAELTEVRYSGNGARVLRAFRGFYFSTIRNCLVMGWIILAMATILASILPGVGRIQTVVISCSIVLVYSVLSGFWGVILTDLFQFGLALTGAVAAAYFAMKKVGGLDGLAGALGVERFTAIVGPLPASGESWLPASALFLYCTMLWWCSDNADGGGIIVQRMSASRDEREAVRATLWFQFSHYALRTWPWVLVALASLVLLPDMTDHKAAYPETAFLVLPTVWRGIFVASLLAAFMSTLVTHLNWGASYLVNDIYRRFINPRASEPRLVLFSRLATVLLMVGGAFVALRYKTVTGAWILTISLGAGAGIVYILRWFWWRVNAWSELSAMIASLAANACLRTFAPGITFPYTLPWIVGLSAIVWVPVTFLTRPTEEERLRRFAAKVRPIGAWGRFHPAGEKGAFLRWLLQWAIGSATIYLFLFGGGSLVLGRPWMGALLLTVGLVGAVVLFRMLRQEKWS